MEVESMFLRFLGFGDENLPNNTHQTSFPTINGLLTLGSPRDSVSLRCSTCKCSTSHPRTQKWHLGHRQVCGSQCCVGLSSSRWCWWETVTFSHFVVFYIFGKYWHRCHHQNISWVLHWRLHTWYLFVLISICSVKMSMSITINVHWRIWYSQYIWWMLAFSTINIFDED